jgi:AraC-like DNA-binding protein
LTLQATVSLSWVRTVLGQAQRQGIEETTLLRAAGIPLQELEHERWPIDHITRLWRAAARLTDDSSFGLKAGSLVSPTSFNVVGFIVQSAPTLRHALTVAQKYQSLISDGGRFQLLAGDQGSWLVYHPRQGDLAFSPHQIEAVLAAVVSASRWITPKPITPQLVRLSHEPVGPLKGYREVFGCPIEFNQVYSGLLIDNWALDQPLPQANAQLARLHEQYASAQLQARAEQQGLDEAVCNWLRERMASGAHTAAPTRAEAATAFGLGERTFARRLRERGTHHNALLDQARRELALAWLAGGERTMREIALHLGFAELSPFYRAFQRWTGNSPRACGQSLARTPPLVGK